MRLKPLLVVLIFSMGFVTYKYNFKRRTKWNKKWKTTKPAKTAVCFCGQLQVLKHSFRNFCRNQCSGHTYTILLHLSDHARSASCKAWFSQAEGIFSYSWHAVGFALPGMLFVLLYHHPPTLTTTLMKLAYAREPQLQLKDALTFFMYLLVVSEMYDSRLRSRIFPRLSLPIPSANIWMRFFPARNRPVNPLWITRDMTSLSELQLKS